MPRGVGIEAEKLRCPFERDAAGLVEADGDGFVGAVDGVAFMGRIDDPLGEDGGGPGLLGLVVEHLEGGDEGPVGVFSEATHAGPDPAVQLLAGLGVTAPGAGLTGPVDRPVHTSVAVVAVGEHLLRGAQVVLAASIELDTEHGAGGVA